MSASAPPVLVLVFNRPNTAKRVLQAVYDAKPAALYVAADGPRSNQAADFDNCQRTRALIDDYDWPCPVHTLYRKKNIGLQQAVITAIDWFFDRVDAGVILEDDCLPSADFFTFCGELLTRYANDPTVMHVSGLNMRPNETFSPYSYMFASVGHIWGWATWRRAWQLYDEKLRQWPNDQHRYRLDERALYRVLSRKFSAAYAGRKNTWSRAWYYTVMRNSGLAIVPSVNMIRNIGFGQDATHTRGTKHPLAIGDWGMMRQPLSHPPVMNVNARYETLLTQYHKGSYFRQLDDLRHATLHYLRRSCGFR